MKISFSDVLSFINAKNTYIAISCKNNFGVKKAWPSKVESYLEVNT